MSDSVRPHPWDSPGKNTGVGCHFLLQCIKVKSESKVTQSCLTPCDPMDCSPPGSSVHGTFQTRVGCHCLLWYICVYIYIYIYVCVCVCVWCVISAKNKEINFQFRSVAQLCLTLCDPTDCSTPGLPVHQQLSWVYSSSCPLSQWWHPTISSSVVPFSSCLQYFWASGSFKMFSASGGQSIGVSASASVLPMNTQDWSPLGWTSWISLQSKGLSRVFSYTTVQKHQFFCTQLSSQSNSHIHTWLLEKL